MQTNITFYFINGFLTDIEKDGHRRSWKSVIFVGMHFLLFDTWGEGPKLSIECRGDLKDVAIIRTLSPCVVLSNCCLQFCSISLYFSHVVRIFFVLGLKKSISTIVSIVRILVLAKL